MSAADEAGEASLAAKGLFAGGIALVAVGNAVTRWREDRALESGK